MNKITNKDVAQGFANAIEILLGWIDQRSKNRIVKVQDPSPVGIEQLLRAEVVARILNISRAHVYHLIELGEIPSVQMGQAVRVRRKDLQDLIDTRAKEGQKQP